MQINKLNVLVTGAAGFIGFHLCRRLLEAGCAVVGIDNLNTYYDVNLKRARLGQLTPKASFTFAQLDLEDKNGVGAVFETTRFDVVVNLAAQAGVRYSIENPHAYVASNLVGFANLLECCRQKAVAHLVFASSSSVYGANTRLPFSVHQNVDHPVSLYAATKKSNELMAHAYSHLYGLPCTGLRFFTVYGPWGRPDMALFLFTRAILAGEPIRVFNHGKMQRDFTYIDDIIEGVLRLIPSPPHPDPRWDAASPDPASSYAPYRIYNIGNNQPVTLTEFIETIESVLGMQARREYHDLQPGDVVATYADVDALVREIGFSPATPLREGIEKFVAWYRSYYIKR
jgi:UDP-glucuronate 4-epimerase